MNHGSRTRPVVEAGLPVSTAEGIVLATDVFRPATANPTPVVVTRTAYDRSSHLAEGLGWARRGIAYVVQDVRGRYGSDGTWTPYRNERADGAALADWILAQPWCDGRLVTMGGSYAACTAWSVAVERPRSVVGVVSLGAALGMRAVKYDRAGILRLAEHAAWWAERAESRTSRTGLAAAMFADRPDLVNQLPVVEIPRRMWPHLTRWADVLDDPDDDLTEADLAQSPVASLHVGGWYDLLGPDTLRHWDVVGVRCSPRPNRTLILGPWDHDLAWSADARVGGRESGEAGRLALGPLIVGWVEAVLAEKTPDLSPAHVFVIGANRWWTGPCWPPADISTARWYTAADGRLAGAHPGEPEPVHYRYDPSDPFPSADPGADRTSLNVRVDAVRFTSDRLPDPLTIMGRPVVQLDASSSRPSTDFVVRLNECTPTGQILELTRAALEASASAAPGPWQLILDPVAATVAAGARLQLEITSSDFPYLARNLNTGADRYRTTAVATAVQTVHTGSTTLTLPITTQPVEAQEEIA